MKALGAEGRRCLLQTRVSATERDAIQAEAVRAGLTVSAYLRAAALGLLTRRVPNMEAINVLTRVNAAVGVLASDRPSKQIAALQYELHAAMKQMT